MNLTETTDSATDTSQLDTTITAVATAADAQTAAAVTTLGLIQQARLSSLTRASTAAVAFYGKDSTQATAAGQAVASTQAVSSRLTVLNQTISTPQPTVTATGWALHGRVYDASLNPAASYTVFLVDAQKNYVEKYGFSYTDATGYFLINYPGSTAPEKTSQAADATQRAGESSSADQASSSQLYLEVADASANPVLLSDVAFTPTTGQATYQVVTLPAGDTKLGDPPAEIRAVALPPAKK